MGLMTCTAYDRETIETGFATLDRWEATHPSWAPYLTPEWFDSELIVTLTPDRSQGYRHCWIDSLDRLIEFEYENGELVSVEIDGSTTWYAFAEWQSPIYRLMTHFNTDSLASDIEAAYRLNQNPLPEFRRVLNETFIVTFGIESPNNYVAADERRDTLVVWVNDYDSVRLEWIPADPPSTKEQVNGVLVIPDGWPWNE